MIIPYNTDAPLYHRPWATVGLIVVNTALLIALGGADDGDNPLTEPWMLHYDGLHPVEWFTSVFIHDGIVHLVGNMFGLWGFGLVVEGKIGWWRMLAVSLAIGAGMNAMQNALALMLGIQGGSYGASGVVFGLLGMSVVWAPRNEMSCMIIFFRVWLVDLSLWAVAGFTLLLQFVSALFSGFGWGSELLHMMGGGVGFVIAVVMLKLNWVDCENWDLFSLRSGKNFVYLSQVDPLPKVTSLLNVETTEPEIRRMIGDNQFALAWAVSLKLAKAAPQWKLGEDETGAIIDGFHKDKLYSESVPALEHYLAHYHGRRNLYGLRLAQIQLGADKKPLRALKTLSLLNPALLGPAQREAYQKLKATAAAQLDQVESLELAD